MLPCQGGADFQKQNSSKLSWIENVRPAFESAIQSQIIWITAGAFEMHREPFAIWEVK